MIRRLLVFILVIAMLVPTLYHGFVRMIGLLNPSTSMEPFIRGVSMLLACILTLFVFFGFGYVHSNSTRTKYPPYRNFHYGQRDGDI